MVSLKDDLLDGADAAAEFLGLKRSMVYALTRNGDIPSIRKGRKLFYRKSDLERSFRPAEPIPTTEEEIWQYIETDMRKRGATDDMIVFAKACFEQTGQISEVRQ